MSTAPPLIPADPLTSFFWDATRRGELHIQRCRACGTWIHLPRPVCRNCRSFDLGSEAVSGRATLYSFTETHKAFHPFFVDRAPYVVATVELIEQPHLHLLTNVVGASFDELEFGMELAVEFEALSDELVIPVFRPVTVAAVK
jgi:uncharacterized protein